MLVKKSCRDTEYRLADLKSMLRSLGIFGASATLRDNEKVRSKRCIFLNQESDVE